MLDRDALQRMKGDITMIVFKFKHSFSSSFFDVMVHLSRFTSRDTARWIGVVFAEFTCCSLYIHGVDMHFNRAEQIVVPTTLLMSDMYSPKRPLGARSGYELIGGEV